MRKISANGVRFVISGLVITLLDFALFKLAIYAGTDVAAARLVGFVLAAGISFVIHHWWTFRSRRPWPKALWLYVQSRLLSFFLAQLAFIAALNYFRLGADISFWIQAPVQPIVNFLLGHFFVFSEQKD